MAQSFTGDDPWQIENYSDILNDNKLSVGLVCSHIPLIHPLVANLYRIILLEYLKLSLRSELPSSFFYW